MNGSRLKMKLHCMWYEKTSFVFCCIPGLLQGSCMGWISSNHCVSYKKAIVAKNMQKKWIKRQLTWSNSAIFNHFPINITSKQYIYIPHTMTSLWMVHAQLEQMLYEKLGKTVSEIHKIENPSLIPNKLIRRPMHNPWLKSGKNGPRIWKHRKGLYSQF